MKTPKINREEVRASSLTIPMTEAEKREVKDAADRLGVTLASFARMVLKKHLNKDI